MKEFYQSLLGYEFVWLYINSLIRIAILTTESKMGLLKCLVLINVYFGVFCFQLHNESPIQTRTRT